MKYVVAATLSLLCVSTASAGAQEQRGSIEGTIRDNSNAVLPGATVEARSPALVGVQQAVSDERGVYRFPALRPGRYEIAASLQGFTPAKVDNVVLERQPAAERLNDGLELRLRKRFANRWSMDTSYLWSHLRGNWSGLASSDEAVGSATGGLQLNSGRAFNLLYYSYDAQGRPSNGLLATDRPNQFKLQVTYDTPWRTLVGANYLLESGSPLSTVADEKGMSFFPYGRGDLGRTPTYSQLDLRVQQELKLPRNTRVTFAFDALNVFDRDVEVGYYTRPYRDGFNLDDQAFFAGFDPEAVVAATPGFARDARYRLAERFQSPRVIRLQARFTF